MLDVLMLIAAWVLGGRAVSKANQEQRWLAVAGFLLIASVMTVLLFAGLGPPPHDAQQWLQTAADQKIRYTLLVLDGLLVAAGLTVLRESLRQAGEQRYSALGFAGIIIATAFYVLDMTHFRAHEFVARAGCVGKHTRLGRDARTVLHLHWTYRGSAHLLGGGSVRCSLREGGLDG